MKDGLEKHGPAPVWHFANREKMHDGSSQVFPTEDTPAAVRRARGNLFPTALLLFPGVLFHHGARGDFFGALAVTSGFFRRFFDVLVLALFFGTRPAEFLFTWHKFTGWRHGLSRDEAQFTRLTHSGNSAKGHRPAERRALRWEIRAEQGSALR